MMDGLGLPMTLVEASNHRQIFAHRCEHEQVIGWAG